MDDPLLDMQEMMRNYPPEDVMAAAAWILGSVGCNHSNMDKDKFLITIMLPVAMAWDLQKDKMH